MPTSNYMPDVIVEIAFNAGWSTAPGSRTWTDVSAYVELDEGIVMGHGRGDERATTDPNTLALTLDNTDGRFTMGRTGSPYYPNVKIGRPIRVRSVPVGGVSSTRFTGFVDSWGQAFPDGVSARLLTRVTATSMLARLGAGAELRSGIEEERFLDGPVAYYPLSEPEGSVTASDVSGSTQQPLRVQGSGASVTFGSATGPATDGLTAATFAGGKYLQGRLAASFSGDFVFECFFLRASPPSAEEILMSCGGVDVTLSADGWVRAYCASAVIVGDIVSSCDGSTHHVTLVRSGSIIELYVDQLSVDSAAAAPTGSPDVYIGGGVPNNGIVATPFTGTVSHFAAYNYDYSIDPGRIGRHFAGISTSTAETSDSAFTRHATYAGVPESAIIVVGADSAGMTYVSTGGRTAIEVMRSIETTQNGAVFDDRNGDLYFLKPEVRYGAASAFTLDASLNQIEADLAPTGDRSTLINDCTVTLRDGSTSATYRDQTSIDAYGVARTSIELDSTDETAPIGLASWLVGIYAEPTTRVPLLSVDLLPLSGATQALVFAADVGTRFAVSNLPSTLVSTSGDYFVEGWTETIGRESYTFTFNVSDAAAFRNVFEIANNPRGTLDSIYRIAY